MDLKQTVIAVLLGGFFLIALIRVFRTPLRLALKLLCNTLLGFLALWVVSLTSGFTGIALGLNLWNALVIGVLGLPGFILLLLVQWVLYLHSTEGDFSLRFFLPEFQKSILSIQEITRDIQRNYELSQE